MEVHHPHHPTHKKKWSEYLLEFFMLFVAVTLGFFAENIRERIAEENKTKEVLDVVVMDFKADIENLKQFKEAFILKNKECDTLLELINRPPSKIPIKLYYDQLTKYIIFWMFNTRDKSRIDAESKGLFYKRENAELANCISQYNFYLKDYKELDQLMATQSKICMYELFPYLTDPNYYTNANFKSTISENAIGIKPPNPNSIQRLKYLIVNTKGDIDFYKLDIDSLIYYGNKAIEIIEKK